MTPRATRRAPERLTLPSRARAPLVPVALVEGAEVLAGVLAEAGAVVPKPVGVLDSAGLVEMGFPDAEPLLLLTEAERLADAEDLDDGVELAPVMVSD